MTVVGILSLQGAFEKHRIAIEHLGVSVCYYTLIRLQG